MCVSFVCVYRVTGLSVSVCLCLRVCVCECVCCGWGSSDGVRAEKKADEGGGFNSIGGGEWTI